MIVCKSPVYEDIVCLSEVRPNESEWEQARSGPVIAERAKDTPALTGG
jgi:hypothetical protein